MTRTGRIAKWCLLIAAFLFILYACFGIKVWGAQWEPMTQEQCGQMGAFLGLHGFPVAVKEGRVDRETGAIELRVFDIQKNLPCIYIITTPKPGMLNIDIKLVPKE